MVQTTHLHNRRLGEYGRCIVRSMGNLATRSVLFPHVRHVLGVSAKEQVTGIDARGSVAAVKNMHLIRYGADMDLIREPVRKDAFDVISNAPVPVDVCVSLPQPTIVRAATAHFGEESFSERVGMIVVHFWSLLDRFRGAAPRDVCSIAGAFRTPPFYQIPYRSGAI